MVNTHHGIFRLKGLFDQRAIEKYDSLCSNESDSRNWGVTRKEKMCSNRQLQAQEMTSLKSCALHRHHALFKVWSAVRQDWKPDTENFGAPVCLKRRSSSLLHPGAYSETHGLSRHYSRSLPSLSRGLQRACPRQRVRARLKHIQ
jgi:hypothetical protein